MRSDALSDLMWRRVSEFIANRAGLHFPPERHSELERGVASAAAELGFPDTLRCVEWLLNGQASGPRLHRLVSHLTVGDTYFFRDRNTFDALAHHVVPELLRRARGPLRLWSAACSTGEEPYSLAILMQQVLPEWRNGDVTILATDINEQSLERAAAGVYGEWSFRNAPAGLRERFFQRTPEGRYAIRAEIRSRVRFERMNLAQDNWSPRVTGANAMDLILCRNVLMYFSNERANEVAANLLTALADAGWLAVSPTECSQTRFAQFTTVNFPDAILYRKPKANTSAVVASPYALPVTTTVADPTLESRDEEPASADSASANLPEPGRAAADDRAAHYAALARKLANEGKLAEAFDATERWIIADRTDPLAHYIQAMVRQELGHREAARRCLQRVIYLEPDFVLAHFALANLALANSRHEEAERYLSNARELLQRMPPEEILPESDGTTAAALAEIIGTLLSLPRISSQRRRDTAPSPPHDFSQTVRK